MSSGAQPEKHFSSFTGSFVFRIQRLQLRAPSAIRSFFLSTSAVFQQTKSALVPLPHACAPPHRRLHPTRVHEKGQR